MSMELRRLACSLSAGEVTVIEQRVEERIQARIKVG